MNYCSFRPHGGSFFLRFPDIFSNQMGWLGGHGLAQSIWSEMMGTLPSYTRGRSLQPRMSYRGLVHPSSICRVGWVQSELGLQNSPAAGYDPDLLSWSGPTHWLWTLGWNLASHSHNFDDQNSHLIFMLNSFYMLIHFVIHIVIHPFL